MHSIYALLLAMSATGSFGYELPDHDWTINTEAARYGLAGYTSRTEIWWGDDYATLPVNIYAVAGILVVGPVLFVCLCVLGIGRMIPRKQS